MGRVSEAQINEAIANFDYEGKLLSKEPFGSGHINDTYLLKLRYGLCALTYAESDPSAYEP